MNVMLALVIALLLISFSLLVAGAFLLFGMGVSAVTAGVLVAIPAILLMRVLPNG